MNHKVYQRKLIKLVDWLQDNTDLAERLGDYPDDETDLNPSGEYAMVERWLVDQFGLEKDAIEEITELVS